MAKKKKKSTKSSKKKKNLVKKLTKEQEQRRLEDELGKHYNNSQTDMQTLREEWDDKEALLICKLEDELSQDDDTKSQVFDPRLSTIVFERAARVMAQNPKGKAYPVSVDDLGKSKFMNLLLDYYTSNANYWHSMIIKMRLMDFYSLVYGSMFALVPWMVNERNNYIGPEFIPLPIRACHPQPKRSSIGTSDWFQVSSFKNLDWIKSQPGFINVDRLEKLVKGEGTTPGAENIKGDIKPNSQRTYIEEEWYPDRVGEDDKAFPRVWLITEYRRDKWYTFAPNFGNLLIRKIDNPFDNNKLPIVAKHCFPLMDSIIGLGEFERGKTLQLAINSLINLYMDGVKYSIFPPVHVNPDRVHRSTLKWGAGAFWLMKNPNVDAQHMNLSPRGLRTFNSTYGFLVSALLNQAGTTTVSQSSQMESVMGKTPQALRLMAAKESSRDEWDRIMMEATIKEVYTRWTEIIVKKQSKKTMVRIFGAEAKRLATDYPDIVEMFDKETGVARIGKKQLATKYDYELITGSTKKRNLDQEKAGLIELLGIVGKAPAIIKMVQDEKKKIDFAEIIKRILINNDVRDYEKIIRDMTMEELNQMKMQNQPSPPVQNPRVAQTLEAVRNMATGGRVPAMPVQKR